MHFLPAFLSYLQKTELDAYFTFGKLSAIRLPIDSRSLQVTRSIESKGRNTGQRQKYPW